MDLSIPTGRVQGLGEIQKKPLAGEGDCTYIKEVLGWTVDTEEGTVAILERNDTQSNPYIDIPAT